jgi:hypothetical protein
MPNDSQPNVLYVVLNGLISLVDMDLDGFDAYLLDRGDEHRYLYGTFLIEDEIPKREAGKEPLRAELLGVDDGSEHLSTGHNALVETDKTKLQSNSDKVRAVFSLPRPAKIHHFVLGQVDSTSFTGNDRSKFVRPPLNLSSIRVFEYTFASRDKVGLRSSGPQGGRFLWTCPAPVILPDRNLAVLHFYDSPGSPLTDPSAHTTEEFNTSTAFLGVDLQLAKPTMPPAGSATLPLLPGLLPGETVCLSMREEFVLKFLDAARLGDFSRILIGDGITGCPNEVCAACNGVIPGGR